MEQENKIESVQSKEFEIRKYKGKTLKRSGKKDDTEWKLWSLEFETGGQYTLKIDAWNSLGEKEDSKSLKIKDLEEGNYYSFGYELKTNAFKSQHGKWCNDRKLFWITESNEEEAMKFKEKEIQNYNNQREGGQTTIDSPRTNVQSNQPLSNSSHPLPTPKELEDYYINYNDKPMPSSFLASWFLNKHTKEAKIVLDFFKSMKEAEKMEDEMIQEEVVDEGNEHEQSA